jgi:cysteine desulfurase/selenocysteine lyase
VLDVAAIRRDFPILALEPNGHPLVYLDNAATGQKPRQVIDRVKTYYESENANVHRGVHYLSEKATVAYDAVRPKVQRFINAADEREIVFTSGNTDAINLVARSWSDGFLKAGDEVLITEMEHHSNIVPWQLACQRTGATLKVAPIDDNGDIILEEFDKLVTEKTKFVSVVYVSNSLGTINPVQHLIAKAHSVGAPILLDAAQAGPHLPIDVQQLDCDFLTLAPHKMFAPTGIGVLYGKLNHLEAMPPYKGGGDMIASVTFAKTTYNTVPFKFEAGTPNMAGVIGLGAAIDYLSQIGMARIRAWEEELLAYGNEVIPAVPGLKLIGTARQKAAVFAFTLESAHPHDIGQILNDEGVAVRAGHHCTQPVMEHFGVPATTRASMALYNTRDEIDKLVEALGTVNRIFG